MSLRDAIRRLHETSERAPDVRHVPMRLVHQDAFDELIAAADAMMRRIDEVQRRMSVSADSTVRWWADELHAATTGRKFLYRCPQHPDHPRILPQCHESGVFCGHVTLGRRSNCSMTAVLVGEVDAP